MPGAEDAQPSESGFDLTPIKKLDVFRAVLAQLETAIQKIGPGGRLGSERELAERLQVSRVSIREALRALESMGKVEIRRGSGTYVTQTVRIAAPSTFGPADHAHLDDLSAAREAIECAVVRAVMRRSSRDFGDAHRSLAQHRRDSKATRDGTLDLRFESALGALCGNAVLQSLQRQLHELWIGAWIQLGGRVADAARLQKEHRAILDAIENGQEDVAIALMANHVNPRTRSRVGALAPGEGDGGPI